ncbi:MAG: anthranilate synthase component I family protein [FCB group bacterium]|nr:anthranilate synthase component I family protein [FCB group bacterium]
MLRCELPLSDPVSFWRKLGDAEKFPCLTWSRSARGWKRIIAFDPVEIFDHRSGAARTDLVTFTNRNRGRFIMGYLSYDLGLDLHRIKSGKKNDLGLPKIHFLAYDNYLEFTREKTVLYYNHPDFPGLVERIGNRNGTAGLRVTTCRFTSGLDRETYRAAFEKVRAYIVSGDIYQMNLTHRLEAANPLPGRELFLQFLKRNPVDFAAYLEGDDFSVMSLSPERFVKVEKRRIVTEPIKGTRPRGRTKREDRRQVRDLLTSSKEQAELYMIIDLLRNDLGKVCAVGSVKVLQKKALRKLPAVWHTAARIQGILREELTPVAALLSMFPGGSITGCPKKRAMEIIEELEPVARGVYTGTIGYILPDGDIDTNIAIRTVVKKGDRLYLGVGGGITIDSEMAPEYQETFDKAKSFSGGNNADSD